MNLKNKLLIIFLACSLSNCSTSSAYMKDRGNDIADIFDLSVGGISAGGVVYLGEKKIGAIAAIEGAVGLSRGEIQTKFDLDYTVGISSKSIVMGTESSFSANSVSYFRKKKLDEINPFSLDETDFKNRTISPSTNNIKSLNSRIGFKVACLISFEVVIYTGEIADFFLGWFGADIYNDDYHKNVDKMKEEL